MQKLCWYKKLIIEATHCSEDEAKQIEDIMRNDILHSSLDWLSKKQFVKAAKEAKELFDFMNSEEGKMYVENLKLLLTN